MRYSVILNGVESAFALKKYLEKDMGCKLVSSNLEEHQGLKSTCKFTFDVGIDDHRKVMDLIKNSGMPVAVADSLREEITSANEY